MDKLCSACRRRFPPTAFVKHPKSPDGLGYLCPACRKAFQHTYYLRVTKPRRQRARKARKCPRVELS